MKAGHWDRTTDLETIRKEPSRFTWGTDLVFHDIGVYCIVQSLPRPAFVREGEFVTTSFHVYVNGESMGVAAETLDGALLVAISRAHLEPNRARYMAIAAAKLLEVKEP